MRPTDGQRDDLVVDRTEHVHLLQARLVRLVDARPLRLVVVVEQQLRLPVAALKLDVVLVAAAARKETESRDKRPVLNGDKGGRGEKKVENVSINYHNAEIESHLTITVLGGIGSTYV